MQLYEFTIANNQGARIMSLANTYTVLIVENKIADLAYVAKLLSSQGFVLHVAENGREGLRLYRELKPDILITDVSLPLVNGLEMSRLIRQTDPLAMIIIIAQHLEQEDLLEAIDLGVAAYLAKPLDQGRLLAALNKCILCINDRQANSQQLTAGSLSEIIGAVGSGESHCSGKVSTSARVCSSEREQQILKKNAELEYRLLKRQAMLASLNREMEDLNDTLSHELRSPLTRLQGFSRALQDDYREQLDETGGLYLERIEQASSQLLQILDVLLELSSLSRRVIAVENVDLSTLAVEVHQELRQQAPNRNVTCVITPGVTVRGYRPHLRLLMHNLLENAWKYTSRRKLARIEFGVAATNGQSIYFVRDDGVGLDMRYVHKLFKPFQRLHDAADFPGAGVGLAAVLRIVRRHGGRIWVEAEEGKGATFYFTLESIV